MIGSAAPYRKRDQEAPQTLHERIGRAIPVAFDDNGLVPKQLDRFAYFDVPMTSPGTDNNDNR